MTISSNGVANVLTITATSANLIGTGTANLGNLVTANYVTGVLTTGAQPNITSIGTLANLTITGQMTYGFSVENLVVKTSSTGTMTHDTSQGATFYHASPIANFVPNFTNVTVADSKATVLALVIVQGATPYLPSAMQIDGIAQTIKWNVGFTPTGTANKIDIISYSLMKVSSNWVILGQTTYYG